MRTAIFLVLLSLLLAAAVAIPILRRGLSHEAVELVGDGRHPETYGFDLEHAVLNRENLAAAGQPVGGIPALDYPPLLEVEELEQFHGRSKYLVPSDLVIGVMHHGLARAYPVQILQWHEVVNDTLAGRPVVITYSPTSGAVAVFDRRIEGRVFEFGVSGLLYNSNLLMYDRSATWVNGDSLHAVAGAPIDSTGADSATNGDRHLSTDESPSLWSQLLATAVAGPALEEELSLDTVPCALIPWEDWLARHPDTRILKRDESRVMQYKRKPYAQYFGNDEIVFPTSPRPEPSALANKARVLSVTVGGERRLYPVPSLLERADTRGSWETAISGERVRIHVRESPPAAWVESMAGSSLRVRYAFWFAWHAMYPEDAPLPIR